MDSLKVITIREAKPGDLPGLTRLMNELGYSTSEEEMGFRFEQISNHPDFKTLVAEHNQILVGFVGFSKNLSYESSRIHVCILALVVDENFRGNQIGSGLVRTVENWAKGNGADRLLLTCGNREERKSAHLFYRNMGFEILSTAYVKKLSSI